MMKRIRIAVMRMMAMAATAACVLLGAKAAAGNGGGTLDAGFGTGGITTMPNGVPESVAVQPDGKIVVVGHDPYVAAFLVARYNANGTPDAGFGNGGIVQTPIGSAGLVESYALALQPDGKILAGGRAYSNVYYMTIARYAPDGSLDPTFGNGGVAMLNLGDVGAWLSCLAVQTDGKIVAIGATGSGAYRFAVARFNADGSVDGTFGSGGFVITEIGYHSMARAGALQPDGKIIAAGHSTDSGPNRFVVARYNADGSLDASFGSGGIVLTPEGQVITSVALQGDGKIVATGTGSGAFTVVRYATNGSLDATFGGTGIVTVRTGPNGGEANGVAVQADGDIVAGGYTNPNQGYADFAVARFRPNGNVDGSFGTQGIAITDVGGSTSTDSIRAVAIQADGKIVAAGDASPSGHRFALARYWP